MQSDARKNEGKLSIGRGPFGLRVKPKIEHINWNTCSTSQCCEPGTTHM